MTELEARAYRKKLVRKIWHRERSLKKRYSELEALLSAPQPADAVVTRQVIRGPKTYAPRIAFFLGAIARSEQELTEWKEELIWLT